MTNEEETIQELAAENARLRKVCAEALPRFIELHRYRRERDGTAHAQDFAEVEQLLRNVLATPPPNTHSPPDAGSNHRG